MRRKTQVLPQLSRTPMIGFSQPIAEKSPLVTGTEKIRTEKDHAPRCPRIYPPLLAPCDPQRLRARLGTIVIALAASC